MKKLIFVLPVLLGGCELFAPSVTDVADEIQWKRLSEDYYEMTLEGRPGVKVEELKASFKKAGTKLCGDKVYLMRGMREEQHGDRHFLKGQLDCVSLDYFESMPSSTVAAKAPAKKAPAKPAVKKK